MRLNYYFVKQIHLEETCTPTTAFSSCSGYAVQTRERTCRRSKGQGEDFGRRRAEYNALPRAPASSDLASAAPCS